MVPGPRDLRRRLTVLARDVAREALRAATPEPVSETLREGERGRARGAIVFPLLQCNAHCPFCSSRTYTPEGITSPIDHRRAQAPSRNPVLRALGVKPRFRPVNEYTHTLDEARAIYDRLRADGVETVSIQGGEPTIFEGICELIAHGKSLGFREQIVITNGRKLRERGFAERLLASGVTGIGLSVFGAGEPAHDAAMGVRGAYRDLLEGVRNLRELGAFARGSPVHCTAQFTLYAANWSQLVEMYRFWRAEGLWSFAVQLLRETDNTRAHPPSRWFFDMLAFKPVLEACLDAALAEPEVFLSFSEVFYCLLEPRYLGLVLRDIPTNPGLQNEKVQVSAHHETVGGFASAYTDHGRYEGALAPCARCDLRRTCTGLEPQYLALFSGRVRPIHVREQFEAVTMRVDPERAAHLKALAAAAPVLRRYGVGDRELEQLQVKLAVRDLEGGARRASPVLDPEQDRRLRDALQLGGSRRVAPEFRWVDMQALGDGASLVDLAALKARWRACDDPALAAMVEPLADLDPTAAATLWVTFAHWKVPRPPGAPPRRGDQLVVTTVFDGRHVSPAVLRDLFATLSAPSGREG